MTPLERVMSRDIEAAMWCQTLADGPLMPDDRHAFDAWIADPENSSAFDEAVRVWRAADQAAALPEVVGVRSHALESYRRASGRRWRRRLPGRRAWIGALAATLALALVGVWVLNPLPRTYETGLGERQIAMLADGTRLSLDADTRVEVRLRNTRRDLTLVRGRAKFDVARDPLRPFAVTAGDNIVVATGTSFSIELLRHEARVLLYEGSVAVLDRPEPLPSASLPPGARVNAPGSTGLTPGRELVLPVGAPSRPSRLLAADPVRSLTWEVGQLNFDDEPLGPAVERVNRYSKREIVIADPALERLRVNGVFEAGDIEAFVEAVTVFNRVGVVERDNQVIFYPSAEK